MPSSSKVISNSIVNESSTQKIETKYVKKVEKINDEASNDIKNDSEIKKAIYKNYESIAQKILESAKKKRDGIVTDAYRNAVDIEKNAYDKGYKAGFEEGKIKGHDDGYKDGYEKNVQLGKDEAEKIINAAGKKTENADNVLIDSANQYSLYLESKKSEIKEVILSICENILKTELSDVSLIDNMIFDVINDAKNTKTFVIRCNSKYIDSIKSKISEWKNKLNSEAEIFAVCDENIEDNSAVIVKNNGKVKVGIEEGISKIREILYGNG